MLRFPQQNAFWPGRASVIVQPASSAGGYGGEIAQGQVWVTPYKGLVCKPEDGSRPTAQVGLLSFLANN